MRSFLVALAVLALIACAFAQDPNRPPIVQPTTVSPNPNPPQPALAPTPANEPHRPPIVQPANAPNPPQPEPTRDRPEAPNTNDPLRPQPAADVAGRPMLTNPTLYGGNANQKRVYMVSLARNGAVHPNRLNEIAEQFRKAVGLDKCLAAGFFHQEVQPQGRGKKDIVNLKMLARFADHADMANHDTFMNSKNNDFAYLVNKLTGSTEIKNPQFPRMTRLDNDPMVLFSGSTLECGAGKLSQCLVGQACNADNDCISGRCEHGKCTAKGLRSAAVTVAPAAVATGALMVVAAMLSKRLLI